MDTYSVFVPFRKGRLALRRKIPSLDEAISCAEAHRATSLGRSGEAFLIVDGTGQTLTIAAARDVLRQRRETSQVERLERAREVPPRARDRSRAPGPRARDRRLRAGPNLRGTDSALDVLRGCARRRSVDRADQSSRGRDAPFDPAHGGATRLLGRRQQRPCCPAMAPTTARSRSLTCCARRTPAG